MGCYGDRCPIASPGLLTSPGPRPAPSKPSGGFCPPGVQSGRLYREPALPLAVHDTRTMEWLLWEAPATLLSGRLGLPALGLRLGCPRGGAQRHPGSAPFLRHRRRWGPREGTLRTAQVRQATDSLGSWVGPPPPLPLGTPRPATPGLDPERLLPREGGPSVSVGRRHLITGGLRAQQGPGMGSVQMFWTPTGRSVRAGGTATIPASPVAPAEVRCRQASLSRAHGRAGLRFLAAWIGAGRIRVLDDSSPPPPTVTRTMSRGAGVRGTGSVRRRGL